MSTPSSGLIVAAVDESEGSLRALDWAAQEARLWGRKLRVVHVVDHPFRKRASRDAEGGTAESHARQLVHEAVERVRKREPDVEVDALHVVGAPGPTLVQQSEGAHVIVAGSRGLAGLRAVLLGSVGIQLAALAECPAVIVPDREELTRYVESLQDRLQTVSRRGIQQKRLRLGALLSSTALRQPQLLLAARRQRLDHAMARLQELGKSQMEARKHRLQLAMDRLELLSPLHVLRRGYGVLEREGAAVTSIRQVQEGDAMTVILKDGRVPVTAGKPYTGTERKK